MRQHKAVGKKFIFDKETHKVISRIVESSGLITYVLINETTGSAKFLEFNFDADIIDDLIKEIDSIK